MSDSIWHELMVGYANAVICRIVLQLPCKNLYVDVQFQCQRILIAERRTQDSYVSLHVVSKLTLSYLPCVCFVCTKCIP